MIKLMRTRFVLTVGRPSPVTAPGINTCRKRFATSLCPGPQCHLGTLRHLLFLQLSCSRKTTRVSWLDTTARILSLARPGEETDRQALCRNWVVVRPPTLSEYRRFISGKVHLGKIYQPVPASQFKWREPSLSYWIEDLNNGWYKCVGVEWTVELDCRAVDLMY